MQKLVGNLFTKALGYTEENKVVFSQMSVNIEIGIKCTYVAFRYIHVRFYRSGESLFSEMTVVEFQSEEGGSQYIFASK